MRARQRIPRGTPQPESFIEYIGKRREPSTRMFLDIPGLSLLKCGHATGEFDGPDSRDGP